MQTKQQIQQLLTSAGASVNKRLGQHFLIDLNLMRLLINSANISRNDVVLEVGCGTGSLTEGLAEHAGYCLAVEYDRILADIARAQLAGTKNVEVINADILENKHTISRIVSDKLSLARRKYTGRFLLVANLPYNVASPVLLNLVTGPPFDFAQGGESVEPLVADGMYVTVQKQVAERMTAAAGSKDYGILSILLAAAGDVKVIRALKPTVFWPEPRVDSAIVEFIKSTGKRSRIEDIGLFSEIVGFFMCHRRKTLAACSKLVRGDLERVENWQDIFNRASLDPRKRPENLSPEDYIAIANLCRPLGNKS